MRHLYRVFYITLFAFIAIQLCSNLPTFAQTAYKKNKNSKVPKTQLRWISPNGKFLKVKWKTAKKWVWAKSSPDDPVESPMLRVWVQIPSVYEIIEIDGNFNHVEYNVSDSPLSKKGQTIYFDTNSLTTALIFKVKNKRGKESHYGLSVNLILNKPLTWQHPSCQELELGLSKRKGRAKYLFSALNCIDNGESIDAYIIHSADAKWHSTSMPSAKQSRQYWKMYRLRKPKKSGLKKRVLGKFHLSELHRPKQKNENWLLYVPDPKKHTDRLDFNVGVGVSYLNYKENPLNVNLKEWTTTGKVGVAYSLIPDLIDISTSLYMNMVALSSRVSPDGLPSARFFGINGRIGFKLPISMGDVQWRILTGWYLWGMLVPNNEYGIQYLSGPQIFLEMRKAQFARRTYSFYFKYAPISSSLETPNLINRELALGGGYQINSPYSKHTWMITLNFSNTTYNPSQFQNEIKLDTFSLGLQYSY